MTSSWEGCCCAESSVGGSQPEGGKGALVLAAVTYSVRSALPHSESYLAVDLRGDLGDAGLALGD